MENNNSAIGAKFGFSKPNPKVDEQKEAEQVDFSKNLLSTDDNKITIEDEDIEYVDERTVTISLVKNYSLYRKANDKVLPKRTDFIGSSIRSSRILSSNKDEVEAYFPTLIGLSINDPNFVNRVKQYLNNIRIPVDELGRTFNVSFRYRAKKYYNRVKAEEDKIEQAFSVADKSTISKLREAIKTKIEKLNILESSKHNYGSPLNLDDYIAYRHCLLYNDVAKDIALIDADPNIRFYFKDDRKEAERLKKHRIKVNKAKANYVACIADPKLFEAVFIQYCVANNLPILSSLAESTIDKEIKLDKFSTDNPDKFNTIFNNKDVKLISTIHMLIARGELISSPYNQNVTTPEGDFIGANIGEVVAWFKNPENNAAVNIYMNKLKNI